MEPVEVSIEWRGGDTDRFSVFFGEQYIGLVVQEEDENFSATIGGRTLPGRFLYRGEAIATLVKEMRTDEMATQLYMEV